LIVSYGLSFLSSCLDAKVFPRPTQKRKSTMLNHNELPEQTIKLKTTRSRKLIHYAVIDCHNRYLTGFIGWAGIWGKMEDKVLFTSQLAAEEQIAFMFIDDCLMARPVKVCISQSEVIYPIKKMKLNTEAKKAAAVERAGERTSKNPGMAICLR
jgi:hypothetical protein